MGSSTLRVAVLGAGHGGMATAGALALEGFPVNLFGFFEQELEPIRARGGIQLIGTIDGFAKLNLITTAIDKALHNVNLILVILPAMAHKTVASLCTSHFRDGQVLLLSPGRTGGAIEFARTASRFGLQARIILAEAQTFLYASETREPALVEIMGIKKKVRIAALPAQHTKEALSILNQVSPRYVAARNVLETSLNNVGAVVHPAPMLLNTGLLDRAAAGEDLRYYRDILTPTICSRVLEKIDAEKVALVKALGLDALSAKTWYHECYGAEGSNLYEALQNCAPYAGYSAPKGLLEYHHVLDEVPNSLVPMASFGDTLKVPTPMIKAIVNLACQICGIDFWSEGRTVATLGLAGLSVKEMTELVEKRELLPD